MSESFYITSEQLQERKWGRGFFTIHDEGLIESKPEFAEESEQLLISNMLAVGDRLKLKIPFKVKSSGAMLRWED